MPYLLPFCLSLTIYLSILPVPLTSIIHLSICRSGQPATLARGQLQKVKEHDACPQESGNVSTLMHALEGWLVLLHIISYDSLID